MPPTTPVPPDMPTEPVVPVPPEGGAPQGRKWPKLALTGLALIGVIVVARVVTAPPSGVEGTTTEPPVPATAAALSSTPQALPLLSGAWGAGDPSVVDVNGTLYESFSDISPAKQSPITVGIALARSSDGGATWERVASIAPGSDPASGPVVLKETSTLVYDAADAAAPYKDIYFSYEKTGDTPDFTHAWIAMRSAKDPAGPWAPEQKVLAGRGYAGSTLFALPSEMQDCLVLVEPSALATPDGFYMSVSCISTRRPAGNRLVLLKFTHGASGLTLSYVGTLIDMQDAARFTETYGAQFPELQATTDLGGADLFAANGTTYLLASPVKADGSYMGCGLFEVTDLSRAALRKDAGVPTMLTYLAGKTGVHRGACTYVPGFAPGTLMFQMTPGEGFKSTGRVSPAILQTSVPLP